MRKNLNVLLTAAVVMSFFSCKRNKEAVTLTVKDYPSIENILPLQLPEQVNFKGQTDNFEIVEAHQDGGLLILNLTYSGGCNEHFFEASWDQRYMKSMPPQVNIRLTHVNNDDACRERLTKEIAVDLRKLFVNTPNQVSIILNGNAEEKVLVSPQE